TAWTRSIQAAMNAFTPDPIIWVARVTSKATQLSSQAMLASIHSAIMTRAEGDRPRWKARRAQGVTTLHSSTITSAETDQLMQTRLGGCRPAIPEGYRGSPGPCGRRNAAEPREDHHCRPGHRAYVRPHGRCDHARNGRTTDDRSDPGPPTPCGASSPTPWRWWCRRALDRAGPRPPRVRSTVSSAPRARS